MCREHLLNMCGPGSRHDASGIIRNGAPQARPDRSYIWTDPRQKMLWAECDKSHL